MFYSNLKIPITIFFLFNVPFNFVFKFVCIIHIISKYGCIILKFNLIYLYLKQANVH